MMDPMEPVHDPVDTHPVETKVKAATVSAAIAGLIVWALQTWAFGGEIPGPVEAAVNVLVPGAAAAIAGFWAPHTPRPDDPEE